MLVTEIRIIGEDYFFTYLNGVSWVSTYDKHAIEKDLKKLYAYVKLRKKTNEIIIYSDSLKASNLQYHNIEAP